MYNIYIKPKEQCKKQPTPQVSGNEQFLDLEYQETLCTKKKDFFFVFFVGFHHTSTRYFDGIYKNRTKNKKWSQWKTKNVLKLIFFPKYAISTKKRACPLHFSHTANKHITKYKETSSGGAEGKDPLGTKRHQVVESGNELERETEDM